VPGGPIDGLSRSARIPWAITLAGKFNDAHDRTAFWRLIASIACAMVARN